MPDEKASGSESAIQSTAQAVAVITEAVPVYQDAVQPAAQEIGKALGGALAWATQGLVKMGIVAEYNIAKFRDEYNAKSQKIPAERLITPDLMISGPAIQALGFTAQHDDLRAMFVNLLVTASDSSTSSSAHPSFAEVIRQLSPSEAKLLRSFLGINTRLSIVRKILVTNVGGTTPLSGSLSEGYDFIESIEQHAVNLDNLERLGIIKVDFGSMFANKMKYDGVMPIFSSLFGEMDIYVPGESAQPNEQKYACQQGIMEITAFGVSFLRTCVM